jgi:hypothetical protein
MTREFSFTYDQVTIKDSVLIRLLGYAEGHIPEPVTACIEEVLKEVKPHCSIRGGYTFIDKVNYDPVRKSISLSDKEFIVHQIVFHQIKSAEGMVLFTCTAGEGITEWSKKMMETGDMLKGYIVDTAGSLIVEAAMDLLQEEIKQEMSGKGLKITNRYSPGYCGWDVAEQHPLFSFFPEAFCGVRLTESALMYPIKSVSGIIGVGEKVRFNDYPCNACEQHQCIYRNLKHQ